MSDSSPAAAAASRERGDAASLMITAIFAAIWGLVGSMALSGAIWLAAAAVVIVGSAILLVGAGRALRAARHASIPPEGGQGNPFATRAYRLAVLSEVLAIPISATILNRTGHPDAVVSLIAVIVGLHFFGLIPAFGTWQFAAVGGAMVMVGLLSLLAPSESGETAPRVAMVGLGCALVLWVGVLPLLLRTWNGAEL